ncbi:MULTISPECIES: hypothetical protein [Flavobacteriaceae]|uniref:hypothetical protein n=1 Tax=Flavobacteriaceae TaxID=49546 RepID=UPI0010ADB9F7|nr:MULTISPECIES: hypothetical protein [Flavobacteriaceae]NJB35875.1 hypothetical protein [Croceivirga sp. JEA036]TKD65838.1 hypothetical protein FBT53_02935 [Flavobacterium sp. ASW18X]
MKVPVSLEVFKDTLDADEPIKSWPNYLQALWWACNENWKNAHDLVDQSTDATSKWVHAHLHREEGDQWNANYWYRQAGKTMPNISIREERDTIIAALLKTN